MSKALVIIDMQKGSFLPSMPRFRKDEVCAVLNKIARIYRANDLPVIHIQHDGSKEKCFLPNTHEWEIIDDIETTSSDLFISKKANDAFYKTNLLDLLLEKGITELTIGGCASDFCVNASVQSALTHDFNVIVLKDGHTTTHRQDLKSKQVVDLFNYIWSNLTPTQGHLEVLDCEEVITRI